MTLPLRDLAVGTFEILEHTPIGAFGFNAELIYRMPDEESWHRIGNHLAPKECWNRLLQKPGMKALVIQGSRVNCAADYLLIRVEPSPKVQFGVKISINEHYEGKPGDNESPDDALQRFVSTTQASWHDFLNYCDSAARPLFENCDGDEGGIIQ
jgi:hypothetical protein